MAASRAITIAVATTYRRRGQWRSCATASRNSADDRHVMGAAERPEREGERSEQSVEQRQRQLGRLQRRSDRQRNDGAERRRDAERQDGAERKPDQRADQRQQHHLRKIDREHAAAARAQRLQGRDHVALPIDVAFHRVGDADAADQQRGQADQCQELGEMLDIALDRRRGIGAGRGCPSRRRDVAPLPLRPRRLAVRSLASGNRSR